MTSPVTVACVWVRGNVPYTAEYVARLAAGARKALGPVRVVCLTDQPAKLPEDVEPFTICPMPGVPGWWAKVHLFNRHNGLTGRVLYLDLDTLIVGDLHSVSEWPAQFATIRDTTSTFRGREGKTVIRWFNSSVMTFDAGIYHDVFARFTSAVAARLWGDQDWLAECHPEAATLPEAWFPRLSSIGAAGIIPTEARVVLSKKPKNLEAAAQWPWFNAIWRAA
ncbi:MAG: hypothetical protein OEW98_00050 [Betaproteobacteria bacterium]|nr:hypothetical protein [Betaproteobacteria bacterium]